MHGILQGNGAGPCIWFMLSRPILDMLSDQGNGATLNLPHGQVIKVVAFAFVSRKNQCLSRRVTLRHHQERTQ